MSIRLRLALWYGGFSLAVIAILAVVALAVHVRARYRGVDELLVAEIADYQQVARLHGTSEPLPLLRGRVPVRLYGVDQSPVGASPTLGGPPPLTLVEALDAHGGPAYGPPLSWLPYAVAGAARSRLSRRRAPPSASASTRFGLISRSRGRSTLRRGRPLRRSTSPSEHSGCSLPVSRWADSPRSC